MSEMKKSGSMWRCFCKRTLAVLTVLCAVGGVIFVTGFGKQIQEAINKMTIAEGKTKIEKRRYDTNDLQT